jgi:hypothetical protein
MKHSLTGSCTSALHVQTRCFDLPLFASAPMVTPGIDCKRTRHPDRGVREYGTYVENAPRHQSELRDKEVESEIAMKQGPVGCRYNLP